MKFLKEWIDERINDEIYFIDYDDFSNLEEIDKGTGKILKKVNLGNQIIIVTLRNLDSPIINKVIKITESEFKGFINKLTTFSKVHPNINRFLGLTKGSDGNYFSVWEYTFERNLNDYLQTERIKLQWDDIIQMASDITRGLMFLHSEKMTHGTLDANNILIKNGRSMITGFHFDYSSEQDIKYDICSLGHLLHELARTCSKDTPSEYELIYQKCLYEDPDLRPEVNEVYEILSQLELKINIFTSSLTTQQILEKFKFNYGLILTGCNIQPSNQAIFVKDGELKISLYEGQPVIYTNINELHLGACINFPIAEITYKGDLSESFSKCMDHDEKLNESFGDFFARNFSVGGQLFIKEYGSVDQTQIDILKFYLFCAYHLAKNYTEIHFNKLFTLDLLPKITTSNGEELNSYEKLTKWMKDLYRIKMIDIISYDLISISQLRHSTLSVNDLETFNKKHSGVAEYEEKLNLGDWVGNSLNSNLMNRIVNFGLFRGLIYKDNRMEISNKITIDFIKQIPKVNLNQKSYLKKITPSTNIKNVLISNNIFSIEDLNKFPFIKNNVKSYEGYDHVLLKFEQYEIVLNKDHIKPTKEFEQVIEEAINSIKPLKALQDIFDEYGHLFPQRIILGRSIKDIVKSIFPNTFDTINLKSPIFESLKPYLEDLNISFFLTQEGEVVENNDLSNWIEDTKNHLEIIEFGNIIPLYKILGVEQQKKIDEILKNSFRIIMTGITELKDLDNNQVEYIKCVYFDPKFSLIGEEYEVYGLIISENNTKLEDIYVNFELYGFNGFYAMIKKSRKTNVDITKCYILWMVVGIPSKFSIFSPNNREVQAHRIREFIKLQPNELIIYNIQTLFPLSQECTIFVHACHTSGDYEPINIVKQIEWKDEIVNVQITYKELNAMFSAISDSDSDVQYDSDSYYLIDAEIDLRICILSTNYKNLKIDAKSIEKVDKVYSAQDYLDNSYPKARRKEEIILDIRYQNLVGNFDLKDFESLESLDCSYNQLASTNFLSSLPFPEKLTYLNISNNNFYEEDLSFLSKFVGLEELRLGTSNERRVKQGKYNRFYGSLKPLRNMYKLKTLEINSTNIDSGYEYLSSSVKTIISYSQMRPEEAKVELLEDALSPYRMDGSWKIDIGSAKSNFWKTRGLEKIDELERVIANLSSENNKLSSEVIKLSSDNNKLSSENTNLISRINSINNKLTDI